MATLGADGGFAPIRAGLADLETFGAAPFVFFIVFMDLAPDLGFALFLLTCLGGFDFFGIAGWATYNVSPTRKSSYP